MSEDITGGDTGTENDHSDAESLLADAVAVGDGATNDAGAKRLAELESELATWKGHARKHEERSKELGAQLRGSKSAADRLAELEQAVSTAEQERTSERAFGALIQVQLRLAEAGVKSEDVAGVLEQIDPSVLLKDGKPNDAAIEKLASSLIKVATRATPDRDQGRRGGTGPVDMNTLIRRAAGVQI